MEPLVRGMTDEIQTFFAFVVGKGLRAHRLPVKVGKERMVAKNDERALPDRCERRKSFVEGEYWSATSDTFVKKENPYKS